jgi:hypothetical protein
MKPKGGVPQKKATRSVETCLENKDDSDSELQSSSSATDILNDSLAAANSSGRSSGHNAAANTVYSCGRSKVRQSNSARPCNTGGSS